MDEVTKSFKLHKKAELIVHNQFDDVITKDIDVDEVIYELRVHQVELEMQNEELMNTQIKLDDSQRKYFDLYNFAPFGYFTLDKDGIILEVNLKGASLLGIERHKLYKTAFIQFVTPDYRNKFHHHIQRVLETRNNRIIDIKLFKSDNKTFYANIETINVQDKNGNFKEFRIALTDISDLKNTEKALKKSEETFREVFNNANDAMFLHKLEGKNPGKFLEVNDEACQSLGYTRHELKNMNPMDIDSPESIEKIPQVMDNLIKNYKTSFEAVQLTKKGELLPVEINTHLFNIKSEKYILSIARDIRERKQVEAALKKSEIKYRTIFNNIQDIFYQTDNSGNILEISPSIERYSGYKPSELIGKSVEMVYLNPQDRNYLINEIEEKGEVADYELILKTKNKSLLYVSTNAHLLFDSSNNPIGIEGSLRDITDRKNIELQLQKSLIEKEMLLKEIHHRVKNNLMIISSLLNLQSRYIKDEESKNIFKESQNRANSMALIHERLYRSTDLKKIDFGDYIRTLANDLYHTYVMDTSLVQINVEVDDLMLDVNTSIPLGLIVNELVTNSLKHAFLPGESGQINIRFNSQDDKYLLEVKDNGIGFPKGIDYKNTDSLGLRLVTSLTEQIDGKIEFNDTSGTSFKIIFTEEMFEEN